MLEFDNIFFLSFCRLYDSIRYCLWPGNSKCKLDVYFSFRNAFKSKSIFLLSLPLFGRVVDSMQSRFCSIHFSHVCIRVINSMKHFFFVFVSLPFSLCLPPGCRCLSECVHFGMPDKITIRKLQMTCDISISFFFLTLASIKIACQAHWFNYNRCDIQASDLITIWSYFFLAQSESLSVSFAFVEWTTDC